MFDYNIRKQVSFALGCSLIVRCCRASLDGPAYPNGSKVRFFSCSVIYNHEYFIGVLKSTYDFCVIMTLKSKYMYFFSIR